jgi:hypothetical protein
MAYTRTPTQNTSEDLLGAPTFADGSNVTGANKERWRVLQKWEQVANQSTQCIGSHWQTYGGAMKLPPLHPGPAQFRNAMCPSKLALHHPAADLLLQYATRGCPIQTGQTGQ